MKKIYITGGMGSGKSTVTHTLAAQGLPYIDLDKVGHEVLKWEIVKQDLVEKFGDGILDEFGQVHRKKLAGVAFENEDATHALNSATLPRIEQAFIEKLGELERAGNKAVLVEYSVFKNRDVSMGNSVDVVIAVLANVHTRIERAVNAGFDKADVKRRLEQQISDEERIAGADVVFDNNGTLDELKTRVLDWWQTYSENLK